LDGLREEALARGISPQTIDTALDGLVPESTVVERDRSQPELTLSLEQYLSRRVTSAMLRSARTMFSRYRSVLTRVSERYGVPPGVLVAIWGLESNFGKFTGVRPTVQALATLAYDGRRAAFFREELLSALTIVDRGHIELAALKGSWAGAMGQPQFMPSSYLAHAVDFDGDGRTDIWTSQSDVFASIANYLNQRGWQKGERWGRRVLVTAPVAARVTASVPARAGTCGARREMTEPIPLSEWRRLGVTLSDRKPLPDVDMKASLVRTGAREFLVYRNYDAILEYNCAHAYGLSVGLLSDAIGP
jgi:membrane-bound lytic murein transglycosylase B